MKESKANNDDEDLPLWRKCVDGDKVALACIYELYSDKMYAYGLSIGFCKHLCRDAVHDVFYAIAQSKEGLNAVDNIEGYLFGSVRNRLFAIYRARLMVSYNDFDMEVADFDGPFIDEIISKERRLIMKQEFDRLIDMLKPLQRKILQYRFVKNLKFDEIAQKMNMTPDAVKKQFYRSITFLKTERQEIEERLL